MYESEDEVCLWGTEAKYAGDVFVVFAECVVESLESSLCSPEMGKEGTAFMGVASSSEFVGLSVAVLLARVYACESVDGGVWCAATAVLDAVVVRCESLFKSYVYGTMACV